MPRLAVLSILALAALLIGAALASITPGGDAQPADRYPTEQEARGAYEACRAAGASNPGECSLWVLDATGFAVGRFPNAAARWVRWDGAGRPDGPLRGDAVGA